MGIEPTGDTVDVPPDGFEDRGHHQVYKHFRTGFVRVEPAWGMPHHAYRWLPARWVETPGFILLDLHGPGNRSARSLNWKGGPWASPCRPVIV